MARTFNFIGKSVGAGSEYVNMTNISQAYTDLVILCNLATNAQGVNTNMFLGTGGSIDTGSNYGYYYLGGNGSTMSGGGTNPGIGWLFSTGPLGSGGSSVPANWMIHVMNYSSTSYKKCYVAYAGTVGTSYPAKVVQGGYWNNTGAIDCLRFQVQGSSFTSNSVFSIYGILAE